MKREEQLQSQLTNLDRMIARAGRPQDRERFTVWRDQLITTMRKEGMTMTTKRKTETRTPEQKAAMAYLRKVKGARVEWGHMASAVGISGRELGTVVQSLLDDGSVTEVPGSRVYTVVTRPKGRSDKVVSLEARRARKQAA